MGTLNLAEARTCVDWSVCFGALSMMRFGTQISGLKQDSRFFQVFRQEMHGDIPATPMSFRTAGQTLKRAATEDDRHPAARPPANCCRLLPSRPRVSSADSAACVSVWSSTRTLWHRLPLFRTTLCRQSLPSTSIEGGSIDPPFPRGRSAGPSCHIPRPSALSPTAAPSRPRVI